MTQSPEHQTTELQLMPVTPREFKLVFSGLILSLALAALDQNIVSTALPQIVSDLHGLEHLSWVVTAFLLCSTTSAPIYGKLSDMYGRKPMFIIAITIFLIGSAFCGIAASMMQLIAFRGLQGLGAGGLITLAQTTIADMVTPRERGKYQGMFGAVFGICSVAGPLLGGYLTEKFSWRWIFYVNIPIGVPAFFLIAMYLKRHNKVVTHAIDYMGALLLTAGTTCLLLMLSLGGTVYSWSSKVVIFLAMGSFAAWTWLYFQERRAREPILPPRLFVNDTFVRAVAVMSLNFMAMLGAATFLPLYFQLVRFEKPAMAGLMMSPMMAGIITTSIIGGHIVARTGKVHQLPVVGLAFATVAYIVIAWACYATLPIVVVELALLVLGMGMGFVMPNLIVAIQNSVDRRDLGAATAATSFFRSLGGSLGVALSGAVMAMQLHAFMPVAAADMGGQDVHALIDRGVGAILSLPPEQREIVINAFRHAVGAAFLTGAVIVSIAFVLSFFLPRVVLKDRPKETEPAVADAGEHAQVLE